MTQDKKQVKKVMFVIHRLHGGGAERAVSILLNNLEQSGIESQAVISQDCPKEHISNYQERVIHIPKKYRFDLRVSSLVAAIRKHRPDMIHSWLPTTFPGSFIAARITGTPYLVSYDANYRLFHRKLPDPIGLIAAFFAGQAVGITSNMPPASMSWPYSVFLEKRGIYVPNAVNFTAIEESPPLKKEDLNLPAGAKIILFVGRFVKVKNVPGLIRAFAQVSEKFPGARLLLAGSGECEGEIKAEVAKLNLDSKVLMPGFREDVWSFMKSAECIVLCSESEGMPNVLCEAMVARLPIVASSIPAHHHLLQNGKFGIITADNSHQALAEAINQLLSEPQESKDRRTEAAYKFAIENFGIQKTVEAYANFYHQFGR